MAKSHPTVTALHLLVPHSDAAVPDIPANTLGGISAPLLLEKLH